MAMRNVTWKHISRLGDYHSERAQKLRGRQPTAEAVHGLASALCVIALYLKGEWVEVPKDEATD